MKVRKVFALSILATSIALAAGCSSDDDDATPAPDPDTTDPMNPDTTDPMNPDTTDPMNPDTTDPMTPDPVMDMSTMQGTSVLDVARGTTDETTGEEDTAGVAELSSLVRVLGDYPALLNALDDDSGVFTVFAPNNAAIDGAVPDGTPASPAIEGILAYHVVPAAAGETSGFDTSTAAGGTFPLTLTSQGGGTLEIREVEGGGYEVVDSDGTAVSLPDMPSATTEAGATIYIIDQVLTPPAEEMMEEEMEEEMEENGGPTAASGTPFAAIESDDSLSEFEALAIASGFSQSLADPNNANQLTFAPTNDAIDATVTTAAAYIVTSLGAPTTAEPAPGTYNGTGEEALEFEVTGSGDTLMVNNLPASFVVSGDGGALVKFGN